ncbi:hypothetical protein KIPB_008181, partial [Kipferlia bialata]
LANVFTDFEQSQDPTDADDDSLPSVAVARLVALDSYVASALDVAKDLARRASS